MYRVIPPLIVLVPQDSNVTLYAQVCWLCCVLYMPLLGLVIACVASVSWSKERRTEVSAFCPREKWGESKNREEGVGEGSEGNACGQTSWFWKPPFASERSSWLAWLVKHYWHMSIRGLKVPSGGKNVRSLFTKSVNFPHGRNEYLVVSFDSAVQIL